jgi:hypothetical protein
MKSGKPRERLLSPEEIGKAIHQEVQESAKGIRGSKRREYLRWAMNWWKNALREMGKKKD